MKRVAVVAFATVVALSGSAAVMAQVGTSTSTAPLITEEGIDYWTSRNGVVPVCWETAGYQREKNLIQAAVEGAWEYWANVDFTGWRNCPTRGAEEHVRVRISPYGEENAGASGSARLGIAALSVAADDDPGVSLQLRGGLADQGRVEYVGVHEFGHVLGFGHEQDAPDNEGPARCESGINPDVRGVSITNYDRNSIMNYCNEGGNMNGRLTNSDIEGVQAIYGARRLSPRARQNVSLSNQASVRPPDVMSTKMGDQTRITAARWRDFQMADAGQASPTADFDAVSRRRDTMEVWWVGSNGSVEGTFWYEGGQWGRYQIAPDNAASVTGGVTALSRAPNTMEIWWIGQGGSIENAYWYEGGAWTRQQIAPNGSAAPGSAIASVAHQPGAMQVAWVGPGGSVEGAFWYEGQRWTRHQIAPGGSADSTGGIAALSPTPERISLFWVGPEGSIEHANYIQGFPGWVRDQIATEDSAAIGTRIAALSPLNGAAQIWWVGPLGSIESADWRDGGHWRRDRVATRGAAQPGASIAAISRRPNAMEIWWVAPNGSLQDAYRYEGGDWNVFELAPAGSASPRGGLTGVSRLPETMEIWFANSDGAVRDAYFYDQ